MILWNFWILYSQKSFLSAFVLMVPKNVFDTFFSRWCTSRSLTSAYFKVGRWTHSSRQNSGWKFGQSIPYTLPWWARWVVDRMLPQQHRILTLDLLERLVHKLHLCAVQENSSCWWTQWSEGQWLNDAGSSPVFSQVFYLYLTCTCIDNPMPVLTKVQLLI